MSTQFTLASHTADLDSYFLYKQGVRQIPAPKPQHKMPRRIRAIIDEMKHSSVLGRTETALVLLDLPGAISEQLVNGIEKMLRGEHNRFSVCAEAKHIEVICHRS